MTARRSAGTRGNKIRKEIWFIKNASFLSEYNAAIARQFYRKEKPFMFGQ
jgi:hypothetical protein